MAEMILLADRQALMRELATEVGPTGGTDSETAIRQIKRLIKMEQQSADGSRATIERSEHSHVKKSGQAALQNRLKTIDILQKTVKALKQGDNFVAAQLLTEAANTGGKKSVKAARKAPTVALYVQYLAETDPEFQAWLIARGVSA